MRIIVLGAGAGGGFPQWNCNCPNCRLAWAGDKRVVARTQSSLAVSIDGTRWLLLNASPDLRHQIIATPALHPRGADRHTPIYGVFVTNGDVDHLTGLLTMREQQAFAIYGSRATLRQTEGGAFGVLNPELVRRVPVELNETMDFGEGLTITTFAVPGKVPLYLENADIERDIGAETETTLGLEIALGGKRVYYIPGCAKVTDKLIARVDGADALFFDGTTFTDDEMVRLGLSQKTAWRMGHVAMSGPEGSVSRFSAARLGRRIFIHINNTNPVLREDSSERAEVARAGWQVGYDGMEIVL
ncbi:MAG: pyrroloquinoline quinone biosynthesis protein PqqB [Hyphomicrobiales bacterium]|nr:pyrroloquinoline quinone biosynthesis protein PqqB [Hyphomicrobiales bacterium]